MTAPRQFRPMLWRLGALLILAPVLVTGWFETQAQQADPGPEPSPKAAGRDGLVDPNRLEDLGISVTQGAAPGYVPDRSCSFCHGEIYRSFQDVGMAKSFHHPTADRMIEDFEAEPFFHAASGRTYAIKRQGETLRFERYILDQGGRKTHRFETKIDWILGSGHTSRTYLYQTRSGELYQLPLAWYSQTGSWGIAPGYDYKDHQGILRRVRRECMFCHNAYPEVPAGSDAYHQPQVFPTQLPEGIGCQRCHGPGAEHMKIAFGGSGDLQALRAAIVNPRKLTTRLMNDVCYECHMQPSIALPGVRQFDRPDYSFRPGQALADYQVQLDTQEADRSQSERFEINHHPYRLEQSRCFQASDGALSCLSCHDPHRKVPKAQRSRHYRAVCIGCHALDACDRGAMAAAPGERSGLESSGASRQETEESDCVSCHMPRRRTQDVVHVVMTDHKIQRQSGGPELLNPLKESVPMLIDASPLYPNPALSELELDYYRTMAVVRAGGGVYSESVDHLEKVLDRLQPDSAAPYLDLARAQLKLGRMEAARETLEEILVARPHLPLAWEWLANTWSSEDPSQAEAFMRRALDANPRRPETRFNLGLLLLSQKQPREALLHLRIATSLRSNMAPGFLHLGNTYRALGEPSSAVTAYDKALTLDPGLGRAYLAAGGILLATGRRDEALRIWKLGTENARLPEPIVRALADAQEETPTAGGPDPKDASSR